MSTYFEVKTDTGVNDPAIDVAIQDLLNHISQKDKKLG